MKTVLTIKLALLLSSLLYLSGCVSTASWHKPMEKFQKATDVVSASAGSYIQTANKLERDAYIDEKANAKESIHLDTLAKTYVLTSDQWSLRLQALTILSKYSRLLSALAHHEAPTQTRENIKSLGQSLKSLTDKSKNETKFSSAIGPIAAIFGDLAETSLNSKTQKILDKVVSDGTPAVQQLISVLQEEMIAFQQRRKSAFSARQRHAQSAYQRTLKLYHNEKAKKQPDHWKMEMLNQSLKIKKEDVKTALNAYDTNVLDIDFSQVFIAMENAHNKLAQYAKSSKKSNDLASLSTAVDLFSNRAARIGEAILELKSL